MSFSFLRKKEERQSPPRLILQADMEGNLEVIADWPMVEDLEQKAFVVTCMVALTCMASEGRLLPMMQQAIGVTGELKGDRALAARVLEDIMTIMKKNARKSREYDVISPEDVFSGRR